MAEKLGHLFWAVYLCPADIPKSCPLLIRFLCNHLRNAVSFFCSFSLEIVFTLLSKEATLSRHSF